jgi:hypothetical protein
MVGVIRLRSMNESRLLWVIAAFSIILVAGCSRACDQAEGSVVDGDGNPLPAAHVTLAPCDTPVDSSELITEECSADGTFTAYSCVNTRQKFFVLTTECVGFVTDKRIVLSGESGLTIVLMRDSTDADG